MNTIVVIPAFDESRTIGAVVEVCRQYADEVIVANDGSADETESIARERGAIVISHMINRGYGAALKTGIIAALRRDADIVVTIDADGQHDPAEIPQLVLPLKRGRERGGVNNAEGVDIVIGNRFAPLAKREGMSLLRRFFIFAGNVITWLLYGTWIADTQSGFRAYTRQALERMFNVGARQCLAPTIESSGMEFSSEVIGEAARKGLKISLVPITVRYTNYSLSKGQNLFEGLRTAGKLLLRRIMR